MKNAGAHDQRGPENTAIIKRAIKAERIVRKACGLISKHHNKLFARVISARKYDALDTRQVDILFETIGSVSLEIQVKSTDNAVRSFYREKKRNRHILAVNPFHYGEDITPVKFSLLFEKLVFYAIEHPFEFPYDWYYHKEYKKTEPPT